MTGYTYCPPPAVAEPLSVQPLYLPALLADIQDPRAGAVVLFSGEARNHSNGSTVVALEYEAYEPMAIRMINNIVAEAIDKFSLHKALCRHRLGRVDVGESAVVVITASSHRAEAYAANRYIIDRVKHEAPIWKKELFIDGTSSYSHNCSCHAHNTETDD